MASALEYELERLPSEPALEEVCVDSCILFRDFEDLGRKSTGQAIVVSPGTVAVNAVQSTERLGEFELDFTFPLNIGNINISKA